VYANTYNIRDPGTGTWKVDLELKQVQANTVFFMMPVEIRVGFTDATDTTIKVENNSNPQEYSFTFSKQPSNLVFDPNGNILLKQSTTVVGINGASEPQGYSLCQNEPNPFRESTSVKFSLPSEANVSLVIIDSSGKQLRTLVNRKFTPGSFRIEFSAEGLLPGIYYLRMESGDFTETKKLAVVK
jgi:hypothetical protein